MRGAARRGLALALALTLAGSALATDVRVQVTNPLLMGLVQDALKALSTGGASYTLVNAPDTIFVLGGAPFSPDVASRSLATTPPRVEFNPESPISLSVAVQAELRRMLNLPGQQAAGTSGSGTASTGTSGTPSSAGSPAGTPTAGQSTSGTSSSATSGASTAAETSGASTTAPSTPGTPATGISGTSTSGTSTPGTSTSGLSKPAVKAGQADLNSDGLVDSADLAIFMANLGKSGSNLPGDLNGDGKVDNADLDAFIKLYRLP